MDSGSTGGQIQGHIDSSLCHLVFVCLSLELPSLSLESVA